jgi:D-glycero-alpha-D-manno-heptose-7-phosphate kinase
LTRLNKTAIPFDQIPLLAHGIEESVAGVPCGLQDHLSALYGGVNVWYWKGRGLPQTYARKSLSNIKQYSDLPKHLLLAYCGVPHESKNINSTWIKQFLSGNHRSRWIEISKCTHAFADAFYSSDINEAVRQLNREAEIRIEMTPDVFDGMGNKLVHLALKENCGARFTGAGGGGCIWALGEVEHISALRSKWEKILLEKKAALLLDVNIDSTGLKTKTV